MIWSLILLVILFVLKNCQGTIRRSSPSRSSYSNLTRAVFFRKSEVKWVNSSSIIWASYHYLSLGKTVVISGSSIMLSIDQCDTIPLISSKCQMSWARRFVYHSKVGQTVVSELHAQCIYSFLFWNFPNPMFNMNRKMLHLRSSIVIF